MLKKISKVLALSLLTITIGAGTSFASNSVQENENSIIDKSRTPEISTTAVLKDEKAISAFASGYTASSKMKVSFSNWRDPGKKYWGTATSSATRTIDYIQARARIYENGGLIGSAQDEAQNSSYAGATAKGDSGLVAWDNHGIGNHRYEDAGFKDIVHETRDDT
ncbi:hypothetical protein [Ornithinibacillus sp. FSL M8-0202]|uniref:hypothetical protein n=1 Tax=Ornithinibacillus sp. FSL M8-0202 TaxID=2921616 RepID=UPI0030CEA38F